MDTARLVWRKSRSSGGDGGNCVELAHVGAVRDSKNPTGPALLADLGAFIAAVRSERLDR